MRAPTSATPCSSIRSANTPATHSKILKAVKTRPANSRPVHEPPESSQPGAQPPGAPIPRIAIQAQRPARQPAHSGPRLPGRILRSRKKQKREPCPPEPSVRKLHHKVCRNEQKALSASPNLCSIQRLAQERAHHAPFDVSSPTEPRRHLRLNLHHLSSNRRHGKERERPFPARV
jgi:hypothetical protein